MLEERGLARGTDWQLHLEASSFSSTTRSSKSVGQRSPGDIGTIRAFSAPTLISNQDDGLATVMSERCESKEAE